MAVVAGKDGAVTFSTGYTAKVRSWSCDIATEEIETTALGQDWKQFIVGVNEWSGSFETQIDTATILTNSSLADLGIGETAATAVFQYGTNGSLTGSIIITGASFNVAVGGTSSTITFTFRGADSLTIS